MLNGFSTQKVLYWDAKLIIIPIQQIILRFQFTNIKQFCTFGGGVLTLFVSIAAFSVQ